MPLQSSGIIVVDKTSVISSQSGAQQHQQQQAKNSVITNNTRQQILGSVISGSVGPITQYKKQQPQQKIIYGISNINNTGNGGGAIGDDSSGTGTISSGTTKSSMRRHQRIISTSSSSSPSSTSSSQQIKQQYSPITQQQQQNFNQQMNQINQQQHVIQSGNQVIVSEEYIEHAQASGTHVVNISANDLLNPQIIKLVSTDGNGQNVLIDSLGNLTTTNGGLNHHHQNSKLVVGNLTVLSSKQQQQLNVSAGQTQQQHQQQNQQQINFVNAKQIPYLTKNQTVQKIVNIPLKTNNILKNQQQHTITGNNIIQATSGGTTAGQIIQKVTMPRNVQVVARVQTVGPNQQQPSQQQNSNQLIMQQKYIHNISGSSNTAGGTLQTKMNNVNMIKKQTINQMKVQHKMTNLNSGNQQQVKTFIHQQQPQQQYSTPTINHQNIQQQTVGVATKQIKSQKIIKQFSNNINSSSTTLTLMQQQQQQQQHLTTTGTYTINNKVNNLQIHQQQQKILGVNSGTAPKPLNNSNTKYVMQNHIVIPSNTNSPLQQQNTIGQKNNNQNLSNSIVVNQQIINTLNNNVCGGNSGTQQSGTIKFVNAHGTVLQTQQQSTIIGNQQKIRQNHLQQQMHLQQQQQIVGQQQNSTTQYTTDGANNKSGNENNIYHIQTTTYLSPQQQNSLQNQQAVTNSTPITDDIVIVNGTQMTDELSARILQSMKSFGNQRQYQQQKIMHTPTSPIIQQTNNSVQQNIVVPREYPIYTSQAIQQQYPTYHPTTTPTRHVVSQPNSRSQSLDRKHHIESKKAAALAAAQQQTIVASPHSSSEFFRVKGDNTVAAQQAEHDDDIIGEEIRPVPVSTQDSRLQALHAFLQDHTYVAPMPTRLPNEMIVVAPTTATTLMSVGQDNNTNTTRTVQQSLQQQQTTSSLSCPTSFNNGSIQTTKMIISESVSTLSGANNSTSLQQQITSGGVYVGGNIIGQNIGIVGNSGITTTSVSGGQSTNNFIGGIVQINNTSVGSTGTNTVGTINTASYTFGQNRKLNFTSYYIFIFYLNI